MDNTLRKAAEMALEALNEVTGWQWAGPMRVMDEVEDAIEALRQALAQPEQSKYSDIVSDGGLDPRNKFDAQQEPIAWLVSDAQGRYATIRDPAPYGEEVYEPLYVAPPKPEPKSISTNDHLCAMLRQVHDVLACTALPMKRPWVGLTDEEIQLMAHSDDKGDWNDLRFRSCWHNGYVDGVNAANAKLKELNK